MDAGRNVFSIAPGAPFLATFVDAFLGGDIVAGLTRASNPLVLARARIYVPTRRAGQALATQFARSYGVGATLLPRILPLGGLEERETAAIFGDFAADFDATAQPQIEEMERRLLLSRLIIEWSRAVDGAILRAAPDGGFACDDSEPFLVAATPAGAYALAAELSALIDEFNIEEVTEARVGKLVEERDFGDYWGITTRFLAIVFEQWPKILEEIGRVDPSTRQRLLVEAQIARLKTQGEPVVAIGSTGAQPTTARLLCAIAEHARGAVVLPGLDHAMSDAAWAQVGEGEMEPAFTHPQTMLKRLIGAMKFRRDDIRELGVLSPPLDRRRRLISQAMLPAESTADWRLFRAAEAGSFAEGLDGVTLLEAPDEQLEALALALFLREALETPAQTAALVTPDRNCARRVAAELRRFEIEIDDSGGASLASTPSGALARLIAQVAVDGLGAVDVAGLLHHPLVRFGRTGEEIAALAPLVESGVLRAVPWSGGLADIARRAREAAQSRHAHPAARRISHDEWARIDALFADIDAAFMPLVALSGDPALKTRVEAHRRCFEDVVRATQPAADTGAATLFELFDRLSRAAAPDKFDASSYSALVDRIAFETTLRGPQRAHPRLKILGPLEARLMDVDLLLIAGLDEAVWPPQTETGAFLNRSMRRALGLSPPERRIGQSAHDFIMAMGAPKVVLSRARKRDGSPTVASRFLTRLEAVAGGAIDACRARGARMLAIAARLDQPANAEIGTLQRPAPRPDVALRPQELSVTRIETLRRDPYAIFAEYILALKPLAPLGADIGARERGTAIHSALEAFVRRYPAGELPDNAREALYGFARENLREFLADPAFETFTWPRLQEGLDHALAFETERRAQGGKIHMEAFGAWNITLGDDSSFRLTAKADRIEIVGENAFIFDYKTGKPPSNREVQAGWAPQLTLEAAMIEAGAFKDIGRHEVAGGAYVGMKDGGSTQWLKWEKGLTFADVVAKHRGELVDMLTQFRDGATPYPSRPYVALMKFEGDYDHLARVKEWSRGGDEE